MQAAVELSDRLRTLTSEIRDLLGSSDMDFTLRNKKGVELHNKVERTKESFDQLVGIGESDKATLRTQLLFATKLLLNGVFGISVK